MRRNLLSRIPAGVGAGKRIADLGEWGTLGSVILATTASGTHGPGALVNDGLTPSLRYVPVLVSRTDPAFMLYPDGSYEGPVPSSAVYALYEEGTGNVAAAEADRTITISATVATMPPTHRGGGARYAAPPDAKRRRQRIAQAREAEAQDMAEMLMALCAAGVLD